jgi:hypothetical protein
MTPLFQKTPRQPPAPKPPGMIRAVVGARVEKAKRHWAGRLQQISERYSKRTKLVVLALSVIVLGGFNGYLVTRSLYAPRAAPLGFGTIRTPVDAPPGSPGLDDAADQASRQRYGQLMQFKNYLDSLAQSPTGAAAYQQILQAHPGLRDSLLLLQQRYETQLRDAR